MSNTSATSPPATAVAVVDEARARVVELADTLWAARTPVELLATATALEKLRSTLDAVQLQVIAEIEATGAARAEGWSSTKDFCTAISGGRAGSGRAAVALARAITTDRAATGRALAAGTISQTQAQVIVAAIDRLPVNPQLRAAAEAALLDDARTRDASELTRSGQYVLERLDPDGAQRRDEQALDREERSAHLGRYLSLADDGIGGVRLKGRGTVEDAAVIKKVLMSLGAPVTSDPGTCGGVPTDRIGDCGIIDCAHDGKDAREHGTRMWDALVDACHQLASTDLLPESHGMRPQVTVTIDHQDLADTVGACGLLDTGERLSAAAVRRFACDADILPVLLGSSSQVLDVGRKSRLVTHAMWLALVVRDRHCAFPGCTRPPVACDAHHVVHWVAGGSTALHNLVLLCRRHHTLIHTTPWEVRINPHDERPEFLPPARLDPERKPIRRRVLRT
ncbi:MAG TPA: DUF222 domain-containing protein [Nocardioidaceae bacterium]|nr:DUF222 domain-containing protein [Nocardioidaceae bacterium]